MNDTALLLVLSAVVCLLVLYGLLRSSRVQLRRSEAARLSLEGEIETRARAMWDKWQQTELATIRDQQREVAVREAMSGLEDWKRSAEKSIRQDAAARSQSVTRGKIAEQFVPYLSEFDYNPKDARFIGSPVDFVVFDGLSDGALKKIVIVEVKTGSSALTQREKQVREIVERGKVSWQELRLPTNQSGREASPIGHLIARQTENPIVVPPLGDSPTQQAILHRWLVANGDQVAMEQPLYELETDKFVAEISSPVSGYLSATTVEDGAIVSVGDVIGFVRTTTAD